MFQESDLGRKQRGGEERERGGREARGLHVRAPSFSPESSSALSFWGSAERLNLEGKVLVGRVKDYEFLTRPKVYIMGRKPAHIIGP